jgi:diketogulonate reductase-like aldo/keto reductase
VNIPTIELSSGAAIPALGLGTWELTGDTCTEAVRIALGLGFTHIDTAYWYGNHAQIAPSIKGVDRESFWITSKVPPFNLHHDQVIAVCDESLRDLGTDYLDMLLMHWPNHGVPMAETFGAFKALHDAGKVRNVGVSNCSANHVRKALEVSELPVVTNQVEFHPLLNQRGLLEYCHGEWVVVTAYSPLGRGELLKDPRIVAIADKHGKTPAQVLIRWFLQKRMIVVPKASSEAHLRDNLGALGWELEAADMAAIEAMDEGHRIIDPDIAEWNIAYEDIS